MNKHLTLVILFITLFSSAIIAQSREPVFRVKAVELQDRSVNLIWYNNQGQEVHRISALPGIQLNDQPVGRLLWDDAGGQRFKASGFSIFIVYRDLAPGVERELWRLEGETSGQTIQTTRRIYDQATSKADYFHGLGGGWPRISDYCQGNTSQEQEDWTFTLGGIAADQAFVGEIAEVVIYPGVLSWEEREQVNTRLSLTYGIPLFNSKVLSYWSNAERIWYAPALDVFRHRVTGIGYDTIWNWKAKEATSSYEATLLSLQSDLPTRNDHFGAFLLWGDDGGGLTSSRDAGFGKPLLRKWRLQATNWPLNNTINIAFHPDVLPELLNEGERWWLAVDGSGTANFLPESTSFISAETTGENNDKIDYALSGINLANRPVFTFTRAPSFFVHHRINRSICDETYSLVAKPVGGEGPYTYYFTSASGERLISGASARDEDLLWEELPERATSLTIQSYLGATYTTDLAPENALYRQLGILPTYAAGFEQRIVPLTDGFFTWSFNEGPSQRYPFYVPDTPGELTLRIDSADCSINLPITITGKSDPVAQIRILNNPSIGGDFGLEVTLQRATGMNLRLIDAGGRQLIDVNYAARHFHEYKNRDLSLPAGVYQLLLSLDGFTHTRTIIIQ